MVVSGFLFALGLLLFFIFWSAWRAYNLRGFVLYLVFWGCIVLAIFCAVHSTFPSSAPRRHVVGVITWISTHKRGRSSSYTVDFKTDDGADLKFDAAATPPFFAETRDKVAVTYLDEKSTRHFPRAIEFRALTGPRAGYEASVSADWFGPWLGVLFAAVVGIAAILGANSNKRSPSHRDASSATSGHRA
jgi:hypothetical protein